MLALIARRLVFALVTLSIVSLVVLRQSKCCPVIWPPLIWAGMPRQKAWRSCAKSLISIVLLMCAFSIDWLGVTG